MKLRTEEAIEILKKYRDWHNDEKMPSELPKPGIYLIGDSLNRAIEVMEESLKAKEKIRVKPLKK